MNLTHEAHLAQALTSAELSHRLTAESSLDDGEEGILVRDTANKSGIRVHMNEMLHVLVRLGWTPPDPDMEVR